ncbi:MAG: hypothetical protein FJY73_07360 [Candidatus Eisenbacteria bacterium]|nr:hypothetical protein [Candidatus Eisenbacteria bacterium]
MARPFRRTGFAWPLLALAFAVLLSCDAIDKLAREPDDPDSPAKEAARFFQGAHAVPAGSSVRFVGPVEPGTVIREIAPEEPAVEMTIPDSAGTVYVFFVDDEPGNRRAHPYRYVWMDLDSRTHRTVGASWDGRIIRPGGAAPAPFSVKETFTLDGVAYEHVEGEGALAPIDAGHKEPFRSPLEEPSAATPPLRGARARERVRHALVIDCGDTSARQEAARAMHEREAVPIAEWVRSYGFTTRHASQWAGSSNETFKPTPGGGSVRNAVLDAFDHYGELFTLLGPPDLECDEFFLYVAAHATGRGNLVVYYPDGTDAAVIGYDEILWRIRDRFPSYVKITLFFDACFSGQSITKNRPTIAQLCERLCAFTLLTSADSSKTVPVPGGREDSATEDFLEGASEDHDGDGTEGDIRDRFIEMRDEFGNRNPMSVHCPETISWCSLDGPNPTLSDCSFEDGVYFVSVDGVDDPGGHRPFIGEPFENPIAVTAHSPIAFTGEPPFVNAAGTISENCAFSAEGVGTVAGFPNVSVVLSGWYDEGSLHFEYTMGARGELPGGLAITFRCAGTRR